MSNENLIQVLERIEKELIIISASLRLLVSEKIGRFLEELDTNEKRRVYELTDGIRSRREIARLTGVSDDTIQGWWDKWISKGFLRKDIKTGRPYKIFSLYEFGIKAERGKLKEDQQNEGDIG